MTKLWLIVRLAVVLAAGSTISVLPAIAQDFPEHDELSGPSDELTSQSNNQSAGESMVTEPPRPAAEISSNTETEQPATTVTEWMAQIEASLTQITAVRVEPTEVGLQIVLETAEGELAVPTTQTVGNTLMADIPNVVLVLPEKNSFEQFNPAVGIERLSVKVLSRRSGAGRNCGSGCPTRSRGNGDRDGAGVGGDTGVSNGGGRG